MNLYVTLSDEEAKRRKTQKTILERTTDPTFTIVVEMNQQNFWTIHEDVKMSIDMVLRGQEYLEQVRLVSLLNTIKIVSRHNSNKGGLFRSSNRSYLSKTWHSLNVSKEINPFQFESKPLVIYSYSISNNLLKEVLCKIGIHFKMTNEVKSASLILGLKKYLKKNNSLIFIANNYNIPIYSFNSISYYGLVRLFSTINNSQ